MKELTLSPIEFKALASQTRVKIIKLLNERNHTLSELAKKLGLASPTIKQHLDTLVDSEIIQQNDEGRKWKYYSLTRKGKNMLQPEQTNVVLLLAMSSIALFGVILMLAFTFSGNSFETFGQTTTQGISSIARIEQANNKTANDSIQNTISEQTNTTETTTNNQDNQVPAAEAQPTNDQNYFDQNKTSEQIEPVLSPNNTTETQTQQQKNRIIKETQVITKFKPAQANFTVTWLLIGAIIVFSMLIGLNLAKIKKN